MKVAVCPRKLLEKGMGAGAEPEKEQFSICKSRKNKKSKSKTKLKVFIVKANFGEGHAPFLCRSHATGRDVTIYTTLQCLGP